MELSKGELAIFNTNDILLKHLSAKLKPLCSSESLRNNIVSQITLDLSNDEIVNLLKTEVTLFAAVKNCEAYNIEKENIGEKLYCKVFNHEPDLAEKITGMILDLDLNILESILNDNNLLKEAIEKCKSTYYSYLQETEYKEDVGYKIYEIARKAYSEDVSSQLTGMLLELDIIQLEKLIINSDELQQKLKLCYNTYQKNFNKH